MHDKTAPDALAAPVDALGELRRWVRRQLGISFSDDQEALFADRVDALGRDLQLSRDGLLARVILGDPDVTSRLADAASTNYTFFFREPEIFQYLRAEVLPQLPLGPLRLWSAATSSGDEAYSLALLCRDYFGDEARARIRILGTDISSRQLRIAERGIFGRDQLQQLTEEQLQRWFSPAGQGQLKIRQELKEMCTFRRLNLSQPTWPFAQRFHLIFMRNVLYYMEPHVRGRVLEACFDVALPGALLVTSLTEPMIGLRTRWSLLRPAIYQRSA